MVKLSLVSLILEIHFHVDIKEHDEQCHCDAGVQDTKATYQILRQMPQRREPDIA